MLPVPGRRYTVQDAIYDSSREEILYCRKCKSSFDDRQEFNEHLRNHLKETFDKPEIFMKFIHKYICNKCDNTFKAKTDLYKHYKTCSGAEYFCKFCKQNLKNISFLKMHLISSHKYDPQKLSSVEVLQDIIKYKAEEENPPVAKPESDKSSEFQKLKTVCDIGSQDEQNDLGKLSGISSTSEENIEKKTKKVECETKKMKKSVNFKVDRQYSSTRKIISLFSHKKSAADDKKKEMNLKMRLRRRIKKNEFSHEKKKVLISMNIKEKSLKKMCKKKEQNKKLVYDTRLKQFKHGYKLRRCNYNLPKERPYTCKMCKRTFTREVILKWHMKKNCHKIAISK